MIAQDPTAWPHVCGEMRALIRAKDWSSTPLGPEQRWPQPLRTLVEVMLGSSQPMFVAWGAERVLLYNDAYAGILEERHPAALGRDLLEVWDEIRDDLLPTLDKAFSGRAVHVDEAKVPTHAPEGRHLDCSYTPVHDATGAVGGVFCSCQDITGRIVAERRMRQSEDRLCKLLEIETVGVVFFDLVGGIQNANDAFLRMVGYSRAELEAGEVRYENLTPPDWQWRDRKTIAQLRATGRAGPFKKRYTRKDGSSLWLVCTGKLLDEHTAVEFIIDVSQRQRMEDALRESEERLRSAVDVGRLGLWDWNLTTGEAHWSDECFRMHGYAVGEVTPSFEAWMERVHPEDRAGTEAGMQRAMETREEFVHDRRALSPDGSVRWLSGRGRFFYDGEGRAVRMLGVLVDLTERRELEERQKLMVAELQHRTRNLMGVVRSIADKTLRASGDLGDFGERFGSRLQALARVQGLLSRLGEQDRLDFDELVRSELSVMDGIRERVTLEGPTGIRLRSSTVQMLAMALHELATNSVKYGALGQRGARLAISWSLESPGPGGRPWLHVDWRESGVEMAPESSAHGRTGQGRELIELALPYQIGAKTSYTFGPDGVHCTMSIPVSARTQGSAA